MATAGYRGAVGVDWVPARPRPGADLDTIRDLAEIHARYVQAGVAVPGGWAPITRYAVPERPVDGSGTGPDGRGEYPAEAVRRLVSRLEIVVDHDGCPACFRVTVIGYNRRFPVSWRQAAFRTMLPEEAAEAVARWRWWYGQIVAGRMAYHLRHLFAWDAYQALLGAQAELRARATATLTRSTAGARRDRLLRARERVFALPEPPPLAPPGPPPTSPDDDGPDRDRDEAIRALAAHLERVTEVTREFNRVVPGNARVRRPEPFDLGDRPVRDEWVEAFFDWVGPYVRTGHGLYLWG
ncbi:hypothetical protein EF879_16800 [Micromonospora sp. HM5-17]|nr:hypothetical protein EF879_16800 [Micromonospora sp. HM5-17]